MQCIRHDAQHMQTWGEMQPVELALLQCTICLRSSHAGVDALLHAGNEQAEDEQRRRSLRRIAKWVTRLLGTADLTPSDSAVALVLVATLQRQARK